jgi:uncharacterized integral membrane protein
MSAAEFSEWAGALPLMLCVLASAVAGLSVLVMLVDRSA